MRVSVIYVAHRTPLDLLAISIDSVRRAANSTGDDLEILIVNNGGAETYEDRLADVRVIGHGRNTGFGEAVNEAVSIAEGDFVLLMNPDSTADESLFQAFREAIDRGTDRSMYGALLLKSGHPQVHAYNVWWGSLQLKLRMARWTHELQQTVEAGEPTAVTRLCGAGLFASRELLGSLGPFSKDFFLYGEDVELSLRAKDADISLILVPRAVIDHDAGTSSDVPSELVIRAQTDAHLRLLSHRRNYIRSVAGRGEVALIAIAGLLISRAPAVRNARRAQLREVQRWGTQRSAPRFDPNERA